MNDQLFYIGQRISKAEGKGTITGVNKEGTYTVVLDSGAILKDQPHADLIAGDSSLHAELKDALVLLAAARAAQSAADRAYQDEYDLWLEQNTDIIRRRAEAKELAEGVDTAARALVTRIYAEQNDKQPHAHAAVAIRPTPKLLVDEKDAVKWAIANNRPDALKLNGSQMNALIKTGIAPEDIGRVIDVTVVNIDSDLNDLLPLVTVSAPEPAPAQEQVSTEEISA